MYGVTFFNSVEDAVEYINEKGINILYTKIIPVAFYNGTVCRVALVIYKKFIDS